MILPWLVIYLLSILGIIVALSITFHSMGPLKVVSIAALFLMVYLYAVVLCFYHELALEEGGVKKNEEGTTLEDLERGAIVVAKKNQGHKKVGMPTVLLSKPSLFSVKFQQN